MVGFELGFGLSSSELAPARPTATVRGFINSLISLKKKPDWSDYVPEQSSGVFCFPVCFGVTRFAGVFRGFQIFSRVSGVRGFPACFRGVYVMKLFSVFP